jgi:hypothetical protein
MPRYKKIPKIKGERRVATIAGELQLRQTEFCGECHKRLKQSATQKPYVVTGQACHNVKQHKSGKILLWVAENVQVH